MCHFLLLEAVKKLWYLLPSFSLLCIVKTLINKVNICSITFTFRAITFSRDGRVLRGLSAAPGFWQHHWLASQGKYGLKIILSPCVFQEGRCKQKAQPHMGITHQFWQLHIIRSGKGSVPRVWKKKKTCGPVYLSLERSWRRGRALPIHKWKLCLENSKCKCNLVLLMRS